MFTKARFIFVISRRIIHLIKTDYHEKDLVEVHEKYDWDNKNLSSIIDKLDQKHKIDHAGFLLNDDLVYVFSSKVYVEDDKSVTSELIQEKIQEKVPENIKELRWDYKINKLSDNGRLIQVAAISNRIANVLSEFARDEHMAIDFVEPISYATARLTADEEKMHLIVYESEIGMLFLASHNGNVYYVKTFTLETFRDDMSKFSHYVRDKYLLDDNTKVLISAVNKNINKELIGEFGFKNIEVKDLNPYRSFQDTNLYKGKDWKTLNINIKEEDPYQESIIARLKHKLRGEKSLNVSDKQDSSDKGDKKKLVIMLIFLAILFLITGFAIYSTYF